MSEAAAAPSAPAEQAPAQESVQSPVDPKSSHKLTPTEIKKYKIDGREVALDPGSLKKIAEGLGLTEEAFVRDFGTSANATRKAQEAAKLRKEVEQKEQQISAMFDNMRQNPEEFWRLAKQMGHNPEKLAEELVWKKIQYEKMSPEGRQALIEKQRADAAEQRVKAIEEENERKMSQAQAQAAEQEIESDVLKILEISKRKAEPGLIRRVAEIIESYMIAKKAKPSPEYVAGKLRDLRRQEFTEDLSGVDLEEFVNTHKDFANRLQEHLVKRARTKDLQIAPSSSAPSKAKASPERQTIDQFFKNL